MFNAYVGRHPKTGKMFIVSDKDLKQKQAQIVLAEIERHRRKRLG